MADGSRVAQCYVDVSKLCCLQAPKIFGVFPWPSVKVQIFLGVKDRGNQWWWTVTGQELSQTAWLLLSRMEYWPQNHTSPPGSSWEDCTPQYQPPCAQKAGGTAYLDVVCECSISTRACARYFNERMSYVQVTDTSWRQRGTVLKLKGTSSAYPRMEQWTRFYPVSWMGT